MIISSLNLRINSQRTLYLARRFSNHLENKDVNANQELRSIQPLKPFENVQDKIKHATSTALSRYNEVVGFKEIDQAYDKISALQESLQTIQNERTLLQLQISNVRSDIANIQTEIHEHKRGERKYLELMKREFEVIQNKNKLEEHYSILDKKEREMFSHLQAKINMLHEKSKSHTRQWGIISTIIGATLGIIGTSISAYYRNNDIRNIQRSVQMQLQEQIDEITKDSRQIIQAQNKIMEHFQRYEMTFKKSVEPKHENNESWAGFFKRKTVSVWRWCFRSARTS